MKVIYKQELLKSYKERYILKIDCIDSIISAVNQKEEICVYYIHDKMSNYMNNVEIMVIPTGQEENMFIDYENRRIDDYKFIDTVVLQNGSLVFHVFARII